MKIQAVHGLHECPCGCLRVVPETRNRNGRERRFATEACRRRWHSRARGIGAELLRRGAGGIIERAILLPERVRRAEMVDLDRMLPQERLGALCRAAEKMKVIRVRSAECGMRSEGRGAK
jgi:hypothetical protein